MPGGPGEEAIAGMVKAVREEEAPGALGDQGVVPGRWCWVALLSFSGDRCTAGPAFSLLRQRTLLS
jgi:hypothetical protein